MQRSCFTSRLFRQRSHSTLSKRQRLVFCLERLESRCLLAADGTEYDVVSPAWFQSVTQADQPGVVAGFVSATSDDIHNTTSSNDPNVRRWVVRFTDAAIRNIGSVAETRPLLVSSSNIEFTVIRGLGLPGQIEVETREPNRELVETAYAANANIDYFFLDSLVVSQSLPTDPSINQQWGLENSGQDSAGKPEGIADADIDASEAFATTTGRRDVIVSVIDSGVDYTHPDLYKNIWINPGEIPLAISRKIVDTDQDGLVTFVDLNQIENSNLTEDSNGNGYIDAGDLLRGKKTWTDGADSDGNGFVDDLVGYDFHNNDPDPLDDSGHGTHVSGIIAASANNGIGIAGVASSTTIMPLKFLSGSDLGATANATRAINYATMMRTRYSQGVRVLNNSWGGSINNRGLLDAINASANADILFVAGSGNGDISRSGLNNDLTPFYPASYNAANIIAVTATGRSDELAPFANFGATTVDIAAPGISIYSTLPGGRFGFRHGTSMATAFVSGAAALKFATVPYATFTEVRNSIVDSADPLPNAQERSRISSGGRLNANKALLLDTVAPRIAVTLNDDFASQGTRPIKFTATFTDDVAIDQASIFRGPVVANSAFDFVITRVGDPDFLVTLVPTSVSTVTNQPTVVAAYEFLPPGGSWNVADIGNYRLELKPSQIVDTAGNAATNFELVVADFKLEPNVSGLSGDNFVDVEFADFNGDGNVDIAKASSLRANVSVQLNNGDGTYRSNPSVVSLDDSLQALATGDFDRDGLADLVTISVRPASVKVFSKFDGAEFKSVVDVPFDFSAADPAFIPTDVVAGDFDLDGNLDLAFGFTSNRIAIAFNDKTGRFKAPTFFITAPRNVDQILRDNANLLGFDAFPDHSIVTGHFNNDQNLDLAIMSSEQGLLFGSGNPEGDQTGIIIMQNQGDGTFVRQEGVEFSLGDQISGDISTGDFNADGIDDFLLSDQKTVIVSQPSGGYQVNVDRSQSIRRNRFVDLDQDGDLDIVRDVFEGRFQDAVWLENNGLGSLTERFFQPLKSGEIGTTARFIRTADVDRNGKLDLYISDRDSSSELLISNETVHGRDGLFAVNPTPLGVTDQVDRDIVVLPEVSYPTFFDGTLRQAIDESNKFAGRDEIRLPAGAYKLSVQESASAPNSSGDLDILDDLVIVGAGPDVTFIDGNQIDRIFDIRPNVTLTLSGVTIRGGNSSDGGGIRNQGTLIANGLVLTQNQSSARGGGLFNTGTVTLTNSTLALNAADDQGGAVFNSGTLTLVNSTVSANTAKVAGGIGNSATATSSVDQSTLTENQSTGTGGGMVAPGGAVVEVRNSILARNSSGTGNDDVDGTFTSLGNNLVGVIGTAIGFSSGTKSDQIGTGASPIDPRLGPLTNNGGPTPTHSPLSGSSVIDRGNDLNTPGFDQRGSVRVLDGDANGTATIDIGAVEFSSFSVTSTADSVDSDLTDEIGMDATGKRTLRASIQQANATIGPDTITLAAATYRFTITGRNEENAAAGDLDIKDNLTIIGAGINATIIDAANLDRVFDLYPNVSLTLRDLTITGGATGSDTTSIQESGGGIRSAGKLTLIRAKILNNRAEGGGGGLIALAGSTATIQQSRFDGNATDGTLDSGGGAIRNEGTLVAKTTTFINNTSSTRGGAILNLGIAQLDNSTISGNDADVGGGWFQAAGRATINNSTISNNQAELKLTSDGGGLFQTSGVLTLKSTTVAENSASDRGGGIVNSAGIIRLENTLLAKNSATTAPDASGAFQSLGNNLIGDSATATGFTNTVKNDLVGVAAADVGLGALQGNGGITFTHALLDTSVALSAGKATGRDQRGAPRTFSPVTSIGAFEASPNTVFVRNTADSAQVPADGCSAGDCSLRAAVIEGNTLGTDYTIVVEPGTYALSIAGRDEDAAATGDLDVSGLIKIIGAGADDTIVDAKGIDRGAHIIANGSLAVSDLSIIGGITSDASTNGGGVLNEGLLTIIDSAIRGNRSAGNGGGIANAFGATLNLNRTVVENNSAVDGGGIYSEGTLDVSTSSLLSNTAADEGGGLYDSGTSRFSSSTIAKNRSKTGGGLYGQDGNVTFINSTISSNIASQSIGAGTIKDGKLTFDSSTIYGNAAGNIGGLAASFASQLTIRNSIVAGNIALGFITDGVGFFDSIGNNLFGDVGDPATPDARGFSPSDQTGTRSNEIDPIVGVLVELDRERGLTMTHALSPTSPAVDAGLTDLPVDQRGLPRPFDGNGDGNAISDIGAYELVIDKLGPLVTFGDFGKFISPGSSVHQIELVFTDASGVDPFTIDDDDVVVSGLIDPITNKPRSLPARVRDVFVDSITRETRVIYEITAPGGSWDAQDDGTYQVGIQSSQISDVNGNFVSSQSLAFTVAIAATSYPTIGSLAASPTPNSLRPDGTVTFVASTIDVSDFAVNARVELYVDVDGDGRINRDVDLLIGDAPYDGTPSATFTVDVSALQVDSLPRRTIAILAAVRGTNVLLGATNILGVPAVTMVTVIETAGPTANLNAPDFVSSDSAKEYSFSVTYLDETGIDTTTLGTGDLQVDGPNGFVTVAQFVSFAQSATPKQRIATYKIQPPGGMLSPEDNGFYSVTLLSGQVTDVNGIAASRAILGGFTFEFVIPINVTGTVSGKFFDDVDGNGRQDANDKPLSGQRVFLDLNQNGKFNSGEPESSTDAVGAYMLAYRGIPNGRYAVLADSDRLITSPTATDFSAQRISGSAGTTEDFAISLDIGNFNQDTSPDIVVANYNTGSVSIRINDGAGGYSNPELRLPTAAGPFSVRTAKLDGTSGDDIVVVNQLSNSLTVFLNDGTGRFSVRQDISLIGGPDSRKSPRTLTIGDIDRDGKDDLAVALLNSVAIFLNRGISREQVIAGESLFAAPRFFDLGATQIPVSIAFDDLDKDKKLDLVIATASTIPDMNRVVLYFGNGVKPETVSTATGLFAAPITFNMTNVPVTVLAGDFEGDSLTDLAIVQKRKDETNRTGVINIIRNDGSRTFRISEQTLVSKSSLTSLAAIDLDGDSNLELIASTNATRNVAIFGRAQSAEFNEESNIPIAQIPVTFQFSVATGDLDGDQKADVVVSDANGVTVLRNSRSGHVVDLNANLNIPNRDFGLQEIPTLDYGDAPAKYPVTRANNGARHIAGTLTLGTARDVEIDGTPSNGADSDGIDDDGVVAFASIISSSVLSTSSFSVTASASAKLDGWIDFNQDGDWLDTGEQVFASRNVVAGSNLLSFAIPAGATAGTTAARFRLSSVGGLLPTGVASDGEVEDNLVTIVTGSSSTVLDLTLPTGDASVGVEGTDLVVRKSSLVILKTPLNSFGELNFAGTSLDDILQLTILESLATRTLEFDGGVGKDLLKFVEEDQTLDLADTRLSIRDVEAIDITGTGNNKLIISVDGVKAASTTTDTLEVVSDLGDTIAFGAGWKVESPQFIGGKFTHLIAEAATGGTARVELRNGSILTNPLTPFDADRDGKILPLDALRIINEIRRRGSGAFTLPTKDSEISKLYFDVNGDNRLTALDALRIINAISRNSRRASGEGESLVIPSNTVSESQFKKIATKGSNFSASTSMPTKSIYVDVITPASDVAKPVSWLGDGTQGTKSPNTPKRMLSASLVDELFADHLALSSATDF